MFQLIIGVISIVLAILLAVMSIWYGGSVFTDNSGKAMYAKLMNEGEQIQAAVQLYAGREGFFPTGTSQQILNSLVDGSYLTIIPPGHWLVQQDKLVRQLSNNDECIAINSAAGWYPSTLPASFGGCPPCNDTAYKDWPSCSNPTPLD
jgi:hypothetical protein